MIDVYVSFAVFPHQWKLAVSGDIIYIDNI